MVRSGFNFPVGAIGWSVVFGEGFELQGVKRILSASNILHSVFSSAALTAHTVEGLREDLWRHAMLVLQDQALLQGDRHGRAVFGTFAAGETHPVQAATDLGRLPEDVHVLVFPGVDVLPQKPQQLRETSLRTRPREAVLRQDFFELFVV